MRFYLRHSVNLYTFAHIVCYFPEDCTADNGKTYLTETQFACVPLELKYDPKKRHFMPEVRIKFFSFEIIVNVLNDRGIKFFSAKA